MTVGAIGISRITVPTTLPLRRVRHPIIARPAAPTPLRPRLPHRRRSIAAHRHPLDRRSRRHPTRALAAVAPRQRATRLNLTDQLGRTHCTRARYLAAEHTHASVLARELKGHDGSDAFLALDSNVPAVFAHDTLRNHQA